jgi:hypothetical protein
VGLGDEVVEMKENGEIVFSVVKKGILKRSNKKNIGRTCFFPGFSCHS